MSGSVANVAVLTALLFFLGYVIAAGLPFSHAVLATLAVLVTQVFPGVLIWRSIRPRDGWLLEDLGMGFAMGVCVAVPVQVVAGLMHSRIPAIVLPLVLAAVLLAVPVTRHRIREARWSPLPWWLGVGIALSSAVFLAPLINYCRTNRLSWSGGPGAPYVDTYLHLALASELLTRGPVEWPTVKGATLGYQWFAHAWIAHVTATSNVGLDQVLMRFMPAILPIVAVVTIGMLGLRLSGSPVVALVGVIGSTVFASGNPFAIPTMALPLTPLSPTLGMGIPTLMALLSVLAMRWRGQTLPGAVVLVPVLTIIATGTKGSTSPVVVAGLGLAILAMLMWNRKMLLPVIIDILIIGVSLGATMIVVFHGSAAGLTLNPPEAATQTFLAGALGGASSAKVQIAALALAAGTGMTRSLFAFVLPFRRDDRKDPMTWVLIGGTIAGSSAVALFYHPGASQYYFQATAIPMAAIGSALGAQRLYHALSKRGRLVILGIGIVGGALFFTGPARLTGGMVHHGEFRHAMEIVLVGVAIALIGGVIAGALNPSRRIPTAVATVAAIVLLAGPFAFIKSYKHDPVVAIPKPIGLNQVDAVSNGELAAARYIRAHSGVEDLVMTNRHCTTPIAPNHCDNRRWLVTAFTERQSFIEGWTATPEATDIAPHGRDSVFLNYWKPQLLALNDDFYITPTAAAQRELWNQGVRWIYMENTMPHAATLAPYATLRFSDPDASAWQLNKP
ncbi:hypothetical protein [Rudaeicoccus suwonensis]|nr:hypothetical protein [Rudaeicoccus suwonensis]